MIKKDRICSNEKIIPVGVKCDKTSTISPSYNIYCIYFIYYIIYYIVIR